MKKTRKSSNEFSRSVESLVLKNKGNLNYIDAVCLRAEEFGIEVETAARLMNHRLQKNFHKDAKRYHLVKNELAN